MFTGESRAEMLRIFNKPPSNAVVRATEMSRAEMRERMGALQKPCRANLDVSSSDVV